MMWKLRNRLFGTHFVALEIGYYHMVCRVQFTATGRAFAKINDRFVWLTETYSGWHALTFDKATWLAAKKSGAKP